MSDKYAVVVTTINPPTKAVQELAKNSYRLNAEFILIGDSKSPANFKQENATYLDLAAQSETSFRYAKLAPTKHYARKNIGYLLAISGGATIIIETDDDNIPRSEFWEKRAANVAARVVELNGWVNVYGYFFDGQIWPRGLPLDLVKNSIPEISGSVEEIYCPIQQGLADENPDVDAIYRLLFPLPINFNNHTSVALRGAWCPFNSQNTTFFEPAFPLLYLPYYCSFRMTDIWRSFVAQAIAYVNGWAVLFHKATVWQERNEHDLMRDFEEEVPGYLHNSKLREELLMLDLAAGAEHIADNMRICYNRLVELKLVGSQELPLLDAWLQDLRTIFS